MDAVDMRQCQECGNSFPARQAIRETFCSVYCYFANERKNTPVYTTVPKQRPEKTQKIVEPEPELDPGESWQRAGMKYEALVKQYCRKDQTAVIIAGNGANLSVKNDALAIKHGITYSPQEVVQEEFNRAIHPIKRIVWCSASGNISYAALKWCYEQNIDLLVVNRNGGIICETNPDKSSNVRIKRAQYAISKERELEIARWIILGKIMGQYDVYKEVREIMRRRVTTREFAVAFHWLSTEMKDLPTFDNDMTIIRMQEARVAAAYFDCWQGIHVTFKDKVPDHWLTVGDRSSPLSSRGQKAIRLAQAILNYAYAILEHASRAALLAVGLDISVGILHADKVGRDSLIYDLMELGRGIVDQMVLSFISKTEFHKGDFSQLTTGEIRLHPELARAVVASCSISPDVMLEHAVTMRNMIVESVNVDESPDT